MHWLDILILVVLGIGAAMGFASGLLWQVARVVGLCVSLYLAIVVNAEVTAWLGKEWKDTNPAFNHIVAFVSVFIGVYLLLYLITRLIHKAIKATKLEMMDRVLGGVLGTLKMAAVVSCVCAVLTALALPLFQEWFEQSTLAPYFAKATEAVISWVPQDYRDKADEGVQQVRDQLQKKITDAALDTLKGDAAKK
jgi:membrane protein required for colicin V production